MYAGFGFRMMGTVCGDQTFEAERTHLPAAVLGDLVGPQGGSPRRRHSGVNRHSSSRPVERVIRRWSC